jgi:hypothetical protein
MKKIGCFTLGLAIIFILTACGPKVVTWQEEAKQADGSMLVLTRTIRLGGGSEIGQSAPIAAESISFIHPKTGKKIIWNSPSDGYYLADPMLLQLEDDRVLVLIRPRSCGAWERYGRPNPAFILQIQEEGKVHNEIAAHLPEKYRYMNLLTFPKDLYVLKEVEKNIGIMTWNKVYEINENQVKLGSSRELNNIDYTYQFKNCGD